MQTIRSLEFMMQMLMEDGLHHAEQIGGLQRMCKDISEKMGPAQTKGAPEKEREEEKTARDKEKAAITMLLLSTRLSTDGSPLDVEQREEAKAYRKSQLSLA